MAQFLSILTKVEKILAGSALLIVVIAVLIDIVGREIFSLGFAWPQKLALQAMLHAGFLGAALVSQDQEHLRPMLADKWWSQTVGLGIYRLRHFLTGILSLFFAYAAFSYIRETKEFEEIHVVLQTPLWILQLVLIWCFVSFALRSFYFASETSEKALATILKQQDLSGGHK
jgi:TRAP-type C4-dicarboxylate transport system permease small subunit